MQWNDVPQCAAAMAAAVCDTAVSVYGELPRNVKVAWCSPSSSQIHLGVDPVDSLAELDDTLLRVADKTAHVTTWSDSRLGPDDSQKDWVKIAARPETDFTWIRRDFTQAGRAWDDALGGQDVPDFSPTAEKVAAALAGGICLSLVDAHLCRMQHHPSVKKTASTLTGAFGGGAIPVDEAQDLVWHAPGVRGRLPIPIRAGTAGLLEAAHMDRERRHGPTPGMRLVYPTDVARVAAGAGSGYLSGAIVGKVLGGMFGLSRDNQKKLQDVGIWSGILKNVIPMAINTR